MEYMEVSLDSLDLRVKGILSSPTAGEWVLADPALWGPGPGTGGLCSTGDNWGGEWGPGCPLVATGTGLATG